MTASVGWTSALWNVSLRTGSFDQMGGKGCAENNFMVR